MQSPVVSDYYGWRSTRLVYVHALRASQYMEPSRARYTYKLQKKFFWMKAHVGLKNQPN